MWNMRKCDLASGEEMSSRWGAREHECHQETVLGPKEADSPEGM